MSCRIGQGKDKAKLTVRAAVHRMGPHGVHGRYAPHGNDGMSHDSRCVFWHRVWDTYQWPDERLKNPGLLYKRGFCTLVYLPKV